MNCAPVRCCCKGPPLSIKPGQQAMLVLDWSPWLMSIAGLGFTMREVRSASLIDVTSVPHLPADPERITIVSGLPAGNGNGNGAPEPEPEPGQEPNPNEELKGEIVLYPTQMRTSAIFEAGELAKNGDTWRFNITLTARDCEGRLLSETDCVMVVVEDC